jgi:Pyruvate/2-oxoacid:ferredoxin oxidoreductase gamma subunit
MVMLGAYLAKTLLFDDQLIIKLLEKLFGEKKAHLISLNQEAITAGREYYNQNYK